MVQAQLRVQFFYTREITITNSWQLINYYCIQLQEYEQAGKYFQTDRKAGGHSSGTLSVASIFLWSQSHHPYLLQQLLQSNRTKHLRDLHCTLSWKHMPITAQLSTIDNTSSLQILFMLSGQPFSGSTNCRKEETVKLQFWENWCGSTSSILFTMKTYATCFV